VLAEHGVCGREMARLGITNQRESGRPLANAIVSQDRRTASHCERLRGAGLESMGRDKTGLLLDPYFGATKLAWLLAHLPGARHRADRAELRSWPEPEDEGRSGAGSDRCGRSDSTIRRTRRSQAACIAHSEIPMINNRRYGTRDIGVGAHGMWVRLLRTGESPDGI
jgi:FGGY family of carbohydrate kinases, N-terminal domain